MLIGHKEAEKLFKQIIKDGNLSHAYIFYGEPQVGKFAFARSFASYIEYGNFEESKTALNETLIIHPQLGESSEASVGIDAMRHLKKFLYEKPVNLKYRVAIINDADLMTDQAQNAILKIAEEPPEYALIILVAGNTEALLPTILSRFQKVYFGAVAKEEIKKLLISEYKVKVPRAQEVAELSFGRPGRAIDFINNEKFIAIRREVGEYLGKKISHKDLVSELADIENKDKIEPFLAELIAELSRDPKKNIEALKLLAHRLSMIKTWNTNRRLQLESALKTLK